MSKQSYNDLKLFQEAKDLSQKVANETGKAVVFGYDGYAGWSHVDAGDQFAIAELGDAILIPVSSR